MEWTRPEYADLVAAMRAAEAVVEGEDRPPLRGFIVGEPASDEG
ncbi:hypothetical protein [Streptomyces sp. NRRL S-337]|nr:hypothetical protein [Streptomyces sp. NRRL S-337]